MKDGLRSTIQDVVKQTLSGNPVRLSHQTVNQSPANSSQIEQSRDKSEQAPAERCHSDNLDGSLVNGVHQSHAELGQPNDLTVRSSNKARDNVMEVSPTVTKQENINRVEPLTDSQIQENTALKEELSTPTASESVNSEMIEKLQWKHKCEIEAIKHNAGTLCQQS